MTDTNVLSSEIKLVQNTALGAVILNRFVFGYAEGSRMAEPTPLPLLFIVLPLVLLEATADCILKTRKNSGLRKFVENLSGSESKSQDLIYSLSARAKESREFTMECLSMAIACGLIGLDLDSGKVTASTAKLPDSHLKGSNRGLFDAATKLGYWCAQTPMNDICETLRFRI